MDENGNLWIIVCKGHNTGFSLKDTVRCLFVCPKYGEECQRTFKRIKQVFLIVGSGMEYPKIQKYIEKYQPENIKLMPWIPKEDYDRVIAAYDVGMIFLDHRFTIPNFPSRLLNYMAAKLPVLACTYPNTDIGKVIVENGFGWCESTQVDSYVHVVPEIIKSEYRWMGINVFKYLVENNFFRKCL